VIRRQNYILNWYKLYIFVLCSMVYYVLKSMSHRSDWRKKNITALRTQKLWTWQLIMWFCESREICHQLSEWRLLRKTLYRLILKATDSRQSHTHLNVWTFPQIEKIGLFYIFSITKNFRFSLLRTKNIWATAFCSTHLLFTLLLYVKTSYWGKYEKRSFQTKSLLYLLDFNRFIQYF
jgi:hypothetical protein